MVDCVLLEVSAKFPTHLKPAGVSHCVASAASASLGDVPLGPLCQDATFHLPNLVADLVHELAGMGDDLWHGSKKIGRAPALPKLRHLLRHVQIVGWCQVDVGSKLHPKSVPQALPGCDDATFESGQTLDQGVQRLHVDVVRRLVQRDDVGLPET